MAAIVWYRRDLRVRDHPALRAARDEHDVVVPFFCFDDRLLHGRHASGPRTQFLIECLHDLRASLRDRGSDLVVRHGRPDRELERVGAEHVYFSEDVSPFDRSRPLPRLALHGCPGLTVVDDVGAIKPYRVFSPFHRVWLEQPRRDVLRAPRTLPPLPAGLDPGRIPELAELGLEQEVDEPAPGGETAGRERLARFDAGRYDDERDMLAADRTSRLSPYLHFGCVSPREVEERAASAEFRRQLCWRDFLHHVLFHHPDNAHAELQERFRGLGWNDDDELFAAWCEGRTGFPLVDAGMRQLRREGWMHNRARLVAGSFLTKDLGIDWRRGERWFMRLLIDGDEASNNGNWQWIASVGVDPQPYFRRMYNPARHMERFDPDGAYVRRYVPELRPVPDEYLREPWTMPADEQRRCGVIVGEHYPAPVVDRAQAREAAKRRYGAAAG